MKNVQFSFERYEKKYFLTAAQRDTLLCLLCDDITADTYGEYTICNIYYDTDDYSLIRKSIEKPVYKEKFRVRSYGTPNDESNVFIEIKKKFNGVVYKRRVSIPYGSVNAFLSHDGQNATNGQIAREIEYFNSFYTLSPKIFIAYDRTAYAGKNDSAVRITFDNNIRCRTYDLDLKNGDGGNKILDDEMYLTEVKLPGVCPLWLSSALTKVGAKSVSFSKYGECYKKYILPNEFGGVNCLSKGELLDA